MSSTSWKVFTLFPFVLIHTPALAVSDAVTRACRNDTFQHCSAHPVGSDSLRRCMRANGPSLSLRCVYALIRAGDVTFAEVKAIQRRSRNAQE